MRNHTLSLVFLFIIGTAVHALAEEDAVDDILVLPGLTADRGAQRIEIEAKATGLAAGEIVEFFIVGESSGHDYEALFVSPAKPGDIHKALEFIGMTAGHPVDPGRMMLWPKGERVLVSCDGVPIESMLLNKKTGEPLSSEGLAFVGSRLTHDGTYAADVRDPHSIASDYNEADTVLDVPRRAHKSAVYGTQVVHPDHVMEKGKRVTITMEPEHKDGAKRVVDLAIEAEKNEAGIAFRISDQESALDFRSLLRSMSELVQVQRDPHITLSFAANLSLADAEEAARMLRSMEGDRGIRIEPPPEGQLFHLAFLPNQRFRERSNRTIQPWELHLKEEEGRVIGHLSEIRETWKEGAAKPDLKVVEHPVTSGDNVRRVLDETLRGEFTGAIESLDDGAQKKDLLSKLGATDSPAIWGTEGEALELLLTQAGGRPHFDRKFLKTRVLLVYAEPQISYSDLMGFVGPTLATHPTVHVYLY